MNHTHTQYPLLQTLHIQPFVLQPFFLHGKRLHQGIVWPSHSIWDLIDGRVEVGDILPLSMFCHSAHSVSHCGSRSFLLLTLPSIKASGTVHVHSAVGALSHYGRNTECIQLLFILQACEPSGTSVSQLCNSHLTYK